MQRRARAVLFGVAIMVGSVFLLGAGTSTVTLHSVAASADYDTMEVTFSDDVFTDVETNGEHTSGTGDLEPGDFVVMEDSTPIVPTGVALPTSGADGTKIWVLSFADPVTPNATTVNINPDTVFDADGDPVVPGDPLVVTLVEADVEALLSILEDEDLELDLAELGALPYIGEWLSNLQAFTENVVEDGEPKTYTRYEPQARALTAIAEDLAGLTFTGYSQQAVTTALESIGIIDSVAFGANTLTITFDDEVEAASITEEHDFTLSPPITVASEVFPLDLEVTTEVTTSLALGGTLAFGLDSSSDAAVLPSTLHVNAAVETTVDDLAARLGFVTVELDDVEANLAGSAELTLSCAGSAARCAPGDVEVAALLTGSADLSVGGLSIAHGGDAIAIDLTDGGDRGVVLTWSDFADPDTPTLDATSVQRLADAGLHRLLALNFRALLLGFDWIANWLVAATDMAELSETLPIVGGTVGELADLSALVSGEVAGLTEKIQQEGMPTAQEAVVMLCETDLVPLDSGTCATLLDPLTINLAPISESNPLGPRIEYELSFAVSKDLWPALNDPDTPDPAPGLDLTLIDDLDGISVGVRGGDWTSSTASAQLSFVLGVKLATESELITALDLGSEPATDPAGVPAGDYTLQPGELCLSLARELGISTGKLLAANNLIQHASPDTACDNLVNATTVKVPSGEATADHTLTNTERCATAAGVWGRTTAELIAWNTFTDVAGCAARLNTTPRSFIYVAPDAPVSPLRLGHRVYVAEVGTTPLASASLNIEGTGIGADATLGFLDLDATGGVRLSPSATLTLSDPPSSSDASVAADGVVDLVELATAADEEVLGDILSVDLTGDVVASFDLSNNLVNVGSPGLDIAGDLRALFNPVLASPFAANLSGRLASGTTSERLDSLEGQINATGPIKVNVHLGDWLSLRDLSPFEVLRMLLDVVDGLADLTDSNVLDHEIPFTGTSLTDMIRFARTIADVGTAVEQRDPETLSDFEDALRRALESAGVDNDAITVSVNATGLSFGIDLGYSTTATYPFDLNLKELLPEALQAVPIQPFDGGARVTATGTVDFAPTLTILFDGEVIADRIQVSGLPTFSASLDANVTGDAYLGPMTVSLTGTASADPSLSLVVPGAGSTFTVTQLRTALDGPLNVADWATWGGPFAADFGVTGALGQHTAQIQTLLNPSFSISGDFADLFSDNPVFTTVPDQPGTIFYNVNVDFSSIKLDLATLVRGTAQTARFVGRFMDRSPGLVQGIPLIGDGLTELEVATHLQSFAHDLDALWDDVEGNGQQLLEQLEAEANDLLCGWADSVPDLTCAINLRLMSNGVDLSGESFNINALDEVRFELVLGQEIAGGLDVDGGLQLGSVLSLDLDTDLEAAVGYQAGLAIGISLTDGFYVDGALANNGLLQLYAKMGATNVNSGITIGGITFAKIVNGHATVGGTTSAGLGPNGDSAGFAVELSQPLTLTSLTNRRSSPDRILRPRLHADIDVKFPVVLEVDGASAFPKLTLPIVFGWQVDHVLGAGQPLPEPSLSIGTADEMVELDIKSLVDGVLAPALAEVAKYNPLGAEPIADALNTEIPIINSTVREVAEVGLGTSPAFRMFLFLVDLGVMAKEFEDSTLASGTVEIGYLPILPASARPTSFALADLTTAGYFNADLYHDLSGFVNIIDGLVKAMGGTGFTVDDNLKNPPPPPDLGGNVQKGSSIGAVSNMVSVPILENPMAALQLVLGGELKEDVTFIEIVVPPIDIGKAIRFNRTLFSLDIGFIDGELTVGLEGAIGLTLRLGFGFDSSGLASGEPWNGIYLVDAKQGNVSIPEIALGGRIGAMVDGRFAVSIGDLDLASVRFRGSGYASLYGGLDLYDQSPALPRATRDDGKFHLREILRVIDAHSLAPNTPPYSTPGDFLCIFRPTVQLYAELAFSGKARVAGVTVFNESYSNSWMLVNESIGCGLVKQPAQLIDGTLVLNAGPEFAKDRFDGTGPNVDERFTLTTTGSGSSAQIHVAWNGAGTVPTKSFNASDVNKIYAKFSAGNNIVNISSAITVPVELHGGTGNDDLQGGGGDDFIDGGPGGSNKVRGNAGNNTLIVGGGAAGTQSVSTFSAALNEVYLGTGNDDVESAGTTVYYFGGEWGPDNELLHDGPGATLDFRGAASGLTGTSAYGEGVIISAGGSKLTYEMEEVATVYGSDHDDHFTLSTYVPDGFWIDGAEGTDTYIVETRSQDREITVTDSGAESDDVLEVRGTNGPDTFLFRAKPEGTFTGNDLHTVAGGSQDLDPAEAGFVARLDKGASQDSTVDMVRYDDSIGFLNTYGVAGANEFALDDVAAELTIEGGNGGSTYQVGQIWGFERDNDDEPLWTEPKFRTPPRVDAGNEVRTRGAEGYGAMSLGVSHKTTIRGGTSRDEFTVYSAAAELHLEGVAGNNLFVLRAFVLSGSITAMGGDGNDRFEYVQNADITIDGGTGFNTMMMIGTFLSDGFVLDADHDPGEGGGDTGGIQVCPLMYPDDAGFPDWVPDSVDRIPDPDGACAFNVEFTRIQDLVVHGLHGRNGFWVRGTSPERRVRLFGGTDESTFLVGNEGVGGGDLTGIQGPILVDAFEDPLLSAAIADAVVLPGEDHTPADEPILVCYDPADVRLIVDGSGQGDQPDGDITNKPEGLLPGTKDPNRAMVGHVDGLGMHEGEIEIRWEELDENDPGEFFVGGVEYTRVEQLEVHLGSRDPDPDGPTALTIVETDTFAEVDRDLPCVPGDEHPYLVVPPEGGATGTTAAGVDSTALTQSAEEIATETLVVTSDLANVVNVRGIDGFTTVDARGGSHRVNVGSTSPTLSGTLHRITAELRVLGETDEDDEVFVDASGTALADLQDLRVDQGVTAAEGVLRRLGMPATGRVVHDSVDVVDVRLTGHDDVANVRGAARPTTLTLHGLAGDDRFFVSDQAGIAVADPTPGLLEGELDDVAGDVVIEAGDDDNLLMVSDRSSDTPAPVDGDRAVLDHDTLTGFAEGTITYRTDTAGTYIGGVTVWTGTDDDAVAVAGTRTDGDPTTLAWEDRLEDIRTITTLNTGAGDDDVTVDIGAGDGFLVVNLGEDDDLLDGSASELGFVVFGGPGNDDITTGSGDDIAFGDEGRVQYGVGPTWTTELGDETLANRNDGVAQAPTRMASLATTPPDPDGDEDAPSGSTNNRISVGEGDDVAWGGLGNAWIEAAGGRNALLGDHGEIRREPAEGHDRANRHILTRDGFIDVVLNADVDFLYTIDVLGSVGGQDVILGGVDDDVIFAGPGNDVIVGSPGSDPSDRGDVIFAGDGDDIVWGGPGNDRIYGGNGENVIDIKQTTFDSTAFTYTVHGDEWWAGAWGVAPPVDKTGSTADNGHDIVYGGRGRDAIQIDVGSAGPTPGDRMMNFYGPFNLFLTCSGQFGAGSVLRDPKPETLDVLVELAEVDGAYDVATEGSSGWVQLALVTRDHARDNRNPAHPDNPGNNSPC